MAGVKGKSGGKRQGAGRPKGSKKKEKVYPTGVVSPGEIEKAVEQIDVLTYHKYCLSKAFESIDIGMKMLSMGNVDVLKAFTPLWVKLIPGLQVNKIDLSGVQKSQTEDERIIESLSDAELLEFISNYQRQLSKNKDRVRETAEG